MEAAHQVCRNQDLPNTDSGGGSTNTNKQLWWYVNSNPGNTPYQFLTQGQMSFNLEKAVDLDCKGYNH